VRKPFTHQVQWRRKGYWSPGGKFHSEEQATKYAQIRVDVETGGNFRVVTIASRHGELSVEQVLVLMKCMHLDPKHWRANLVHYMQKGAKPPAGLNEEEVDLLLQMSQTYPMGKLVKLNEGLMKSRLKIADARVRARQVASRAADMLVIDTTPEVMPIAEGFFVQGWVFVPNRTEEQEVERQHDLAAYLAGSPWPDAAGSHLPLETEAAAELL
jgi:hypothetical protein